MRPANLPTHCKRAGFTLAEAIASLVIMALIIGAIFAFEISAARVTARSGRAFQAETRASDALRAIAREMKEGISITSAQPHLVEYTYPATESGSRYFAWPLAVGYRVRYYRGNKVGVADSNGTYLWRADDSSGSMQPTKLLADKVAGFTLTYHYPTGSTSPDAVTVEVAAQVTSSGKTNLATYRTTVKLRNYGMLGM